MQPLASRLRQLQSSGQIDAITAWVLRAAALAGQGIALCPKRLIADDLSSGRLVQLFSTDIKHDYSYSIIEPGTGRRSEAVETFKGWLLSTAQG